MTKHEIANAMRVIKAELNKTHMCILNGETISDERFKTQVLYSLETIATAVRDLAVW